MLCNFPKTKCFLIAWSKFVQHFISCLLPLRTRLVSEIAHMCWWRLSIIAVGDDFFSIAATTKRFKHLIDTLMMSLSLSRRTMCWLSVLHGISFCFEVGLGKLLRRRVAGKVFKEKHRSFFLQNSCENKLVRVKSFPTEFGISHSIALTN